MEEYKAALQGKDTLVRFSLELEEAPNPLFHISKNTFTPIESEALVMIDNQWEKLTFDMLNNGKKQVHLRAVIRPDDKCLHIESIQKGIINNGQDFLKRTVKQGLRLIDKPREIIFANIMHSETLELLEHISVSQDPTLIQEFPNAGPLLSALFSLCNEVYYYLDKGNNYMLKGAGLD